MMIDQATPMIYSPIDGMKFGHMSTTPIMALDYRERFPAQPWKFNPWTGLERRPGRRANDPYGLRINPSVGESSTDEADPHGKNPHELGAKMDAGKAPIRRGLLEYFPRACIAVAQVSASGAEKYAWNGWETVPDGVARYGDAEARHICKAAIEGAIDRDYGHLHAAHEAWNALARLELILREGEGK